MSTIHFLNVKEGDCTWIKHNSGRISLIDVFNASKVEEVKKEAIFEAAQRVRGNFGQKNYPVNPIQYLKDFNIQDIFRFILTHPDMDHMGGIKDLFETFSVINFWDTANNKEKPDFTDGQHNEEDWDFYQSVRNKKIEDVTVLNLYSGATGQFYNQDGSNNPGGDGLHILAPTIDLVSQANESGDYNDCSYVLLYKTAGRKIVFGGDSHDKTWEHILSEHENSVKDVDVLFAPHHGRDSGRSYEFLDVLKPKITYFGNAKSEHLAYKSWYNRGLEYITNNQANCIVTDISIGIDIYVTYETFARAYNSDTFYNNTFNAWYIKTL
ncbi:MAG: ComEC family competence protein [Pelotomaculum sp. PtaU1.Bin035]|nr:MAG: ComEC family competence protein [Pelotomaculum sp. PtaU1.Bin035]